MKGEISKLILNALEKTGVKISSGHVGNLIEIPPSREMGDYAFPCFFLSKQLRKNPHEIAKEIAEKIPKGSFEKVVVNGAYINFFMDRKDFSESMINKILKAGKRFGSGNIGGKKKVLIEHTSINPNASPHVGRARNAIIGDSLVRIYGFLGFRPEVHYYVNDVSKQIAMLVLAKAEKLKFEKMLGKYGEIAKKVGNSKELEKNVFEILRRFEEGDKKTKEKFRKITNTALKGQIKILAGLGIHYDFFDYESSYMKKAKDVLHKLEKTGKLFVDEQGRKVLDLKGTSVEGKMKSPVLVLTRSDGTGLYPLRDLAYTIEKSEKSANSIVILGEDQKLYFQQISEALKMLHCSVPKVVHYSFILLNDLGERKKMSTRRGDVVLLEDFFRDAEKKAGKKTKKPSIAKKISIAAVKYSILKNHPDKSISFSLEDSLNFEGDTGPYLLYSYARASSILRKAKKKTEKNVSVKNLDEKEFELLKELSKFPEMVLSSYKSLNPSVIANYSYHISQMFNRFYHSSKVIGSENETFKLKIVECFKIVMKNSLNLLGINAIEKM